MWKEKTIVEQINKDTSRLILLEEVQDFFETWETTDETFSTLISHIENVIWDNQHKDFLYSLQNSINAYWESEERAYLSEEKKEDINKLSKKIESRQSSLKNEATDLYDWSWQDNKLDSRPGWTKLKEESEDNINWYFGKIEQQETSTEQSEFPELWDSINQALTSAEFQEEKQWSVIDRIKKATKDWWVGKALRVAFDFISDVLWAKKTTKYFRFNNNKEIQDILNNAGNTVEDRNKAISILKTNIHSLQNWTNTTKKRVWLATAMSRLQDYISLEEPKVKQLLASKSSQQEKNIALMAQQVEPWDMLVLNKLSTNFRDNALTKVIPGRIEANHIMMVQEVNKEIGEITIAHSSMNKANSKGKWVEIWVNLLDYVRRYKGVGIAAIEPPNDINRSQFVDSVKAKNWAKYDSRAAIFETLFKRNTVWKNEAYNCWELLRESMYPDSDTSFSHPAEFLEYCNPKYVTTAWKNAKNLIWRHSWNKNNNHSSNSKL